MKYVILVFSLALLILLISEFNDRTTELNRLSDEKVVVETQLASNEGTKAALEEQITYATSEAAVVKWAHESGHMVQKDENPVVPIGVAPVTPTPTPQPVIIPTEVANWQLWLSLFIKPSSP